ncbi:hypothetical protein M378DRAFT_156101 [Amanita muscaria Koide BX008]|uniref:DUF1682-domain-containing protein n=1 Tax=Amanita muscaria (strain Koide BX008) TaxID=946122 RepID=A0A0C2TRZ5_AMAMK|nr:hypothetical protein M378DRAFT_156101 [Amanita muscaria Koide BX008]
MATVALNKLLAGLSPPPFVQPEHYDGLEFKWKIFVLRPGLFKAEACLLGVVLFYTVWFYFGASVNKKKANKWLEAHLPIYEQQFSTPSKGGLVEDGHSDFFNFSTGRRNVESLHTIFRLRPRHDLLQWAFQTGRTFVDLHYNPKDEIQLDFKLAPGALAHNLVWAVVAKDELRNVKEDRWDLTFTKTTENPALPPSLSVMSEYADVTDHMLKPLGNFSLLNFLKDTKISPYFRSLSVTDQPRQRPLGPIPAEEREWHVILSLGVPDSSGDTAAIVSAMFGLVDALNKLHIHPEIKSKLKKTREDLDKELKAEAQKEKQEHLSQAVEDKKAAKRKVEEERIAKLSAAEQQKILEKERKKTLRKSQAKMVRK